jgi:hypothetical protein
MTQAGVNTDTAYGEEGLGWWSLREGDSERCRSAFRELQTFVEYNGPFDGLIGFSEGASIGATLLIEMERRLQQEHQENQRTQGFKLAVFFCGLSPVELRLEDITKKIRLFDPAVDGIILNLPTAHFWSQEGEILPGLGKDLVGLCNAGLREELLHNLGHDVPGSRCDAHVRQTIHLIKRTIERAATY